MFPVSAKAALASGTILHSVSLLDFESGSNLSPCVSAAKRIRSGSTCATIDVAPTDPFNRSNKTIHPVTRTRIPGGMGQERALGVSSYMFERQKTCRDDAFFLPRCGLTTIATS